MSAFAARGRPRLPHLFEICARTGRAREHACTQWLDRTQRTQRRIAGDAVTTSIGRADSRPGCRGAISRMGSHDAWLPSTLPRQVFYGVSALLLVASAALTALWSTSMSAMGGMPMPGGWTMSMAWMRMPGQTWPGAAASFLGMWVVMMMAMMLPSLTPTLWRYRQAVGRTAASASTSLVELRRAPAAALGADTDNATARGANQPPLTLQRSAAASVTIQTPRTPGETRLDS
jgi:hypothetical protein